MATHEDISEFLFNLLKKEGSLAMDNIIEIIWKRACDKTGNTITDLVPSIKAILENVFLREFSESKYSKETRYDNEKRTFYLLNPK